MEKMMKRCMEPHALLHTLSGIGVGMLILALVPSLSANAMMYGGIALLVGVVGEFMVK